jgi:hypothetical protein
MHYSILPEVVLIRQNSNILQNNNSRRSIKKAIALSTLYGEWLAV